MSGEDYILPSRIIALVLILCVAMAAWFRLGALDASGFAEDEIDILRAVESYQHFDFAANAEHPMLGNLLAFGSLHAADEWNHIASRLRVAVGQLDTRQVQALIKEDGMAITVQRNVGMLLLAVRLIFYGLAGIIALVLPAPLTAGLAFLAGVLIFVGR